MVQNLLGNNPKRWDKRGVVLEVLPHRQYKVKMDGSRYITLRNRKHLRKFEPVVSEPNNPMIYGPIPVSIPKEKLPELDSNETSVTSPAPELGELPQMIYRSDMSELAPTVPTTPERSSVVGQGSASLVPSEQYQPSPWAQQLNYTPPREVQPAVATPIRQACPSVPVQVPSVANYGQGDGSRRSSRQNMGQTTKFGGFATGTEYDEATAGLYAMDERKVLYAVKLPPGFEQVGLIWTDSGWMQWA